MIRVAHVVPIGSRANASVIECASNLASAQVELGVAAEVHILSPEAGSLPRGAIAHRDVRGLVQHVQQHRPDLVHLHGLWTLCGRAITRWAGTREIPVAISVHGMLMPEAFRVKLWKKLPYWHLVERQNVQRTALLHTTSDLERECILRRTGRDALVLPNGSPNPPPITLSKHGLPERYFLFVGRLHPIKNVEALLRARVPGLRITVVIAGDGAPRYRRRLQRIAELNLDVEVRFVGWISAADKWRWLAHAVALVLPSRSESFGNVVLEALAVGTPVIASRHTPWAILEEEHAGWWVPANEEGLGRAMAEAWSEISVTRRIAAQRLAERFSWRNVAGKMLEAYSEVAHVRGGQQAP